MLHGHPLEFKTFNVTIDFTFQLAYYDEGIGMFNLHNYFYAKPDPEKLNDLMRRIHHTALKNISEKKYDYSGEYPREDLDKIFNDINKRFFNLEQDWKNYFTQSL